jgi:hypothetical protein
MASVKNVIEAFKKALLKATALKNSEGPEVFKKLSL